MWTEVGTFLRGVVLGLSIAVPVGPIGVLCIRRTLSQGRLAGFISGLGAASADAIYGGIAAFGLTAAADFLVRRQFLIQGAGGLALGVLGVRIFFSEPIDLGAKEEGKGWVSAYTSTLFLTLTNPATLLFFAAIFAGMGWVESSMQGDELTAGLIVAGVFLGSGAWWFLLSGVVNILRSKFGFRSLRWVNRISGILLFAFGAYALQSALLGS
jgi:threonine/homoserine/homoserine lactone efflux protein